MKKGGVFAGLGCAGVAVGGLILLAVVLVVFGVGQYNSLVGLEEEVTKAWSQVENVYQRRADLIPNLVETVKGAADFEQDTFEAVANARSRAGQINFQGTPTPEQLQEYQAAQGELSQALSRLMLVVERYPELKATDAFRDLQAQLEGTENRITVERGRYNDAARVYNTARRRVPTVFVANLMGFEDKAYFEAQEGAEQAPRVDFSDDG